MGRRSVKKTKKQFTKVLKRSNNMYILNFSLSEIFSIFDSPTPESALILNNIVITGVAMMSMSQIAISAKPEDQEYVDKLPSYKDVKRKFTTSEYGRTLASCAGIASAFPYIQQDPSMREDDVDKIITIVTDMVDMPSPNVKRIRGSISEWPAYAKGEAGGAFGQINSCPGTNLRTINIEPGVIRYGLSEAIDALGFEKDILERFEITPQSIRERMRNSYLTENTGMPVTKLEYNEPSTIYSKIQEEVLGENMVRTGVVNTKLVKGLEPEAAISKTQITKYLNPREAIAYKFAINSGDRNILKKYNDIIKDRSKADPSNKA